MDREDCDGGEVSVVKAQLSVQRAILSELNVLTAKVKDDDKCEKVSSEWKLVAMVVDRLCFCIFTVLYVTATIVIFRRQLLL